METQQTESVRREQELWQKELQDVNFSYAVLKAENLKHELRVRQLERELSKRNDALVATETQRVAHLEDKLHKRWVTVDVGRFSLSHELLSYVSAD